MSEKAIDSGEGTRPHIWKAPEVRGSSDESGERKIGVKSKVKTHERHVARGEQRRINPYFKEEDKNVSSLVNEKDRDEGGKIEKVRDKLETAEKMRESAGELLKEAEDKRHERNEKGYDKVMREQVEDSREVLESIGELDDGKVDEKKLGELIKVKDAAWVNGLRGFLESPFGSRFKKPVLTVMVGLSLASVDATSARGLEDGLINLGVRAVQREIGDEVRSQQRGVRDEIKYGHRNERDRLRHEHRMRDLAIEHNHALERARREGKPFDEARWQRKKDKLEADYRRKFEDRAQDMVEREDWRRYDRARRTTDNVTDVITDTMGIFGRAIRDGLRGR